MCAAHRALQACLAVCTGAVDGLSSGDVVISADEEAAMRGWGRHQNVVDLIIDYPERFCHFVVDQALEVVAGGGQVLGSGTTGEGEARRVDMRDTCSWSMHHMTPLAVEPLSVALLT